MLLQDMRTKGRGELADRWDRQSYIIVKQPDAELPVYIIRREVGDFEKVVHQNLLRPCSLPLPPEERSSVNLLIALTTRFISRLHTTC